MGVVDNTLLMQIFGIVNAAVFGAVLVLIIQFLASRRHHKKQPHEAKPVPPEHTQAKEVHKLAFDANTKKRIVQEAEASFQSVLDKSVASLQEDLEHTTDRIRRELEKIGQETEGTTEAGYETLSNLQTQVQTILNTTQANLASHQTGLSKRLSDKQAELEEELIEKVGDLEEQLTTRQLQLQAELNERQAELEANLARRHAEVRTGLSEQQEKIEADLVLHQTELESALTEREASLAKIQTKLDAELETRRHELETKLNQEIEAKRAFLEQQMDSKLSDAVMAFLLEALQHNIDLGSQSTYLTTLLEENKAELKQGVQND